MLFAVHKEKLNVMIVGFGNETVFNETNNVITSNDDDDNDDDDGNDQHQQHYVLMIFVITQLSFLSSPQ